MQEYKIVEFKNTQQNNDVLIALLNDLQFDSYDETNENELKAYISKELFNLEELTHLIHSLPLFENIEFEISDLENKNWNDEWEKNFEPIVIGDKCVVRAPFHPKTEAEFELVIEPRMAFGTGHHATTEMMLKFMLSMDFENKQVLDFGCGTGILSLLAEMKGAKLVDANDIEEPAYLNTIDNAQLNNCTKINALFGDVKILPNQKYNIILANVTTLTIQENLKQLDLLLASNGEILLSGILEEQKETIIELCKTFNYQKINELQQDKWIALHYSKK